MSKLSILRPMPFSQCNHPEEYEQLTDSQKNKLQLWIKECLIPHKTKNYNYGTPTSYGLKHRFQYSNVGFYVTNGQFKGSMLAAGFTPRNKQEVNWVFKLGKKAGIKRDIDK